MTAPPSAPDPAPPPKRLRWSLEPTLGPVEPAYRQQTLPTDIEQARWVAALTVVGFLLANLVDLIGHRFSPDALARLLVFGAHGTFTLLLAVTLRRITVPATYDRLMVTWALSYVAVVLYLRVTTVAIATEAWVVLIAFGSYTVIPNRLAFRALPAALLTAGDLLILLAVRAQSLVDVLPVALVYAAAHAVGLWASVRHYTGRRQQFLAWRAEAGLRTELEERAHTDMLTGLLTRRRWIELAEAEFSRHRRHPGETALLMADLDRFKEVNDRHGHLAGDAVLRRFADILRDHRRRPDLVGRLGGEEFGLLLPETGRDAALAVARRILDACREVEVPSPAGPIRFTCSIGLTVFSPADSGLDDALARVDRALYRAKESGRDRVESD